MKRIRIAVIVPVVVLLLLAFRSSAPLAQYLGSAIGVFLGFVLGVWWQEEEKGRARKKCIDLFWSEFKVFIPDLESRVRLQISTTCNQVFDNVFECRLPLSEITYLCKRAEELELDTDLRRKLNEVASHTRLLEEYVDHGAERIMKFHSNFRSEQETLNRLVLELKTRYP